jgi:hypothetical protein
MHAVALITSSVIFFACPCSGVTSKHVTYDAWTEDARWQRLRGSSPDLQEVIDEHPEERDGEDAVLYDDFLDVMNHAAAKALSQQRAIPAYQDFLKYMKHGADRAREAQNVASQEKSKTEEPSYVDFVKALERSSEEPIDTYRDFLATLKAGAENAMHAREKTEGMSGPFDILSGKKEDLPDPSDPFKTSEEEHKKLRDSFQRRKAAEARARSQQAYKKPVMTRINLLRTELCWQRPNLMHHEKCLKFLGIHCMTESTGHGICRQFHEQMKDACKKEKDPQWKEDYCAIAEALDESAENSGEDEHQGEEAEGIQGHEDDEEEFSDDDDDLVEEDFAVGGSDGAAQGHAGAGAGSANAGGIAGAPAPAGSPAAAPAANTDSDGDGIPDSQDAFAHDPSEWKDTDKDGIGDNKDKDLDGDGYDNEIDVFPNDPKEWKDSDHDGIGDNSDDDLDGDGVANKEDAFPSDPTEWKDSDGDGVGDNKDAYPFNPKCHDPLKECHDVKGHKMPKPGSPQDPATYLDKDALKPLPEQGFNEASDVGPKVNHENYYTWVSDWQDEWPTQEDMTEEQTMRRICNGNTQNVWCRKYLRTLS